MRIIDFMKRAYLTFSPFALLWGMKSFILIYIQIREVEILWDCINYPARE
jgi:hypothetical protein